MFGGDVGAVYIAGQSDGDPLCGTIRQPEDFNITAVQFQSVFNDFLLNFKLNGQTVYKEQIRSLQATFRTDTSDDGGTAGFAKSNTQCASIRVDLEHLSRWRHSDGITTENDGQVDSISQTASVDGDRYETAYWGEISMQAFRRHPLKYIPAAETAVNQVYDTLCREGRPNISTNTFSEQHDKMTQPNTTHLQLEVISRDRPTKMRDLKAGEVESLVVVPGIILQASKPVQKGKLLKLQCKDCKTEKSVKIPSWRQAVMLPRTCDVPKRPEEQRCGLDPYVILSDESYYIDVQTLKLQELPEDVPTGDMPRHLTVNCAGSMCGRVIPGERIYAVGVFASFEHVAASKSAQGQRMPYLHCMGIDYCDESGKRRQEMWTYQEAEDFRRMSRDLNILDHITQSIAPAIFGCDDVKRAIACLLFSGSRKRLPDNTRVRGDINLLLLGDPSTAKSQFLKFVDRCAPIAVYTSGKGSSAAGLTAAIIRDAAGNFALEGGAMVLADGGVVCIDEFDKMRDDDRVAIHEAMEQQTISIAKAGITTVLNTQCAVLAAANPSFGSYDDSKDTTDQHDFETTILSRFDMIWIIRDERSVERDKIIARHIFQLHAGISDPTMYEGMIPVERLKKYISYCRAVCDPRLSECAAKKLENYYVEVRENCRSDIRRKRDQIPITVRQLESLARISESLAKMTLSAEVTEHHVDEAIRLFQLATIEASKSSIARQVITPEEREMILAAESAILQRLPVYARASKSTIIRDLRMRGYEAPHISRALRALIHKGELEERGDASVRRLPSTTAM